MPAGGRGINRWARTIGELAMAMHRGYGYPGEAYWDEEEAFIRSYFRERRIERSLSVGCGLFRELDTLCVITRDEVWGIDNDKRLIRALERTQPVAKPMVRIKRADLYSLNVSHHERFDLVALLFHTIGILPDKITAARIAFDVLRPGGFLLVSVWRDDEQTTAMRRLIYAGSGGRCVRQEWDESNQLVDIVVVQRGVEVFRSAIMTSEYLVGRLLPALGDAECELYDLGLSRVMVLRRPS